MPKVRKVGAGSEFSLALTRNGTVWSWGDDSAGELGRPNGVGSSAQPQKIFGLNRVIDIAAGAEHVLALKEDGSVWAWGDESYGELGDGAFCGPSGCWRSTPKRVPHLPRIARVAAGGQDSAVIDRLGRVWSWGRNDTDQLGTGLICSMSGAGASNGYGCATNRPALVKGLGQVTRVAIGFSHVLALRSDHSLYAWGDNETGELGRATGLRPQSKPVLVNGLDNEATSIAAGDQFSLIVRSPQL